MTFTAKVRDFRGMVRADLDLSRVALVAGPNGAGKTSLLQGVAAVVAGNVVPVAGLKKSSAGALVRTGAPKSGVQVSTEAGAAQIMWPAAEYSTTGKAPQASPYATGLMSVADLDDRRRAAVLVEYLKAEPTRDDLAAPLRDAGLPDVAIDKIWQAITVDGWDASHARAKETGIKFKGAWEAVTGSRYGSKQASTWQPDDWEMDLDGASEDSLKQGVATSKEFLEASIAAAAVDAHERGALQAKAAQVEACAAKVRELDLAHQTIKGELGQARSKVNTLPPVAGPASHQQPCPHCGQPCVVIAGLLKKPGDKFPNEAENAKRKEMLDAAQARVAELEPDERTAAAGLEQARRELYDAAQARERLAGLPAETGAASRQPIDTCRENVRQAEARLAAFQRKVMADRHHRGVTGNQAVIDALAPDGVRQQRLARMLHEFNEKWLAPLCAAAGWLPVTIGPAMDIEYGGRPFPLLSASEQYRCRAVLALAMAAVDGSALVILDAADVLDRVGRRGLFKLLVGLNRPVLVAMTLDRNEVPDLAAKGTGVSYWISEGVAEPIGGAAQEKQGKAA